MKKVLAADPEKEKLFKEKISSIKRAILHGAILKKILGSEVPFEVLPPGSALFDLVETEKISGKNTKEKKEKYFPRKYSFHPKGFKRKKR